MWQLWSNLQGPTYNGVPYDDVTYNYASLAIHLIKERPNRKNVQPQGLGQLNLAMCPLKMSIPSSVIKHGLLENPPFVVIFSPLRPLFIGDSQSLITRAYIQGTVICLVVWKMYFFRPTADDDPSWRPYLWGELSHQTLYDERGPSHYG